MISEDTIQVITYSIDAPRAEYDSEGRDKGGIGFPSSTGKAISKVFNQIKPKIETVQVDTLKAEMTRLVNLIEELLDTAERETKEKELKLDEIELSVEISEKGELKLFGAGALASGTTGAIKLKFKRQQKQNV
ncbi:Pepco domain-containing protein [Dapis sp. BLCC M229]|uniref:Pepco domain-containing protein n=1 Tax=Dapis sp. BLCC M229 TaxID=3400188 RepID=UPI003CE9DA3C